MQPLTNLFTLVSDSTIAPDAWGDYFLNEAITLVIQIKDMENPKKYLDSLDNLQETAQARLLQAVTSVETPEIFPDLIQILQKTTPEIAEIIVDNLRTWNLNDEDRQELIRAAQFFKGKWSVLLDQILDSGKF